MPRHIAMLSTGLNRQDNKNRDLRRRGTIPYAKVDGRLLNLVHKEFWVVEIVRRSKTKGRTSESKASTSTTS